MIRKFIAHIRQRGRASDARLRPDPMVEVDKCLAAEKPKPDLAKAPLDKPGQISNELPPITHPVRRTSKAGIDLIHMFEGYARKLPDGSAQAYPDPGTGGKPWTIGWGSTTDENGKPIKPGDVWTRERADSRFAKHLQQFEAGVLAGLKGAPVTQQQFDALVSFSYNLGVSAFQGSTLLRRHRAGNYAAAADEFLRWNRAAGKVMAGLTRRRQAERRLYLSGSIIP